MRVQSITIFIISFLFCLITSEINAQDGGNVINFMQTIPQSNYNNPATIPSVGFYLGIPVLSAINIGIDNGNFSYNNLFTRRADDSLIVDVNKFIGSLNDNNKLSYNLSTQLFALGFKVDRSYFTFSVNSINSVNANYTKDFMTFLLEGNGPFIGQNVNLGDFRLGLNSYIETALGFSREINKQLSIGVRFKYLIGIANVYTERSNVNLYTDPTNYDLAVTSDVLIKTSMPIDSLNSSNVKWQDIKQNNGIAFDFGGEYKLNSKFTFGLSVVDLGYINWSNDVQYYQTKNPNSTFGFNGFDINTAFKNGQINDSVINNMVDSLKNSLGIQNVKGSKYRAPLDTKIYLTASYALTTHDCFGIVLRNDIINQVISTSLTVSYNRYVGKNLTLTFANTVVAGNILNPGGGFSLNLGCLQFYFIVDHASSFYAADIRNFGLQFGFNLVAGKTKPGQRYTKPAPVVKDNDDDRKSRKHKINTEPVKTDTTVVKPPVMNIPKRDTLLIKADSTKLKTKLDTLKPKIDILKTDSLKLKMSLLKTDTLNIKKDTLLRIDSLKLKMDLLKTDTLNIKKDTLLKMDTVKLKIDTLKLLPPDTLKLLKIQDTTLKKSPDSTTMKINDTLKNVLIPVDTTIKKLTVPADTIKTKDNTIIPVDTTNKKLLLPIDSVKQAKPLDTIPAINKTEGNIPINQVPDKNPANNDAGNTPPATIPNETNSPPKQ